MPLAPSLITVSGRRRSTRKAPYFLKHFAHLAVPSATGFAARTELTWTLYGVFMAQAHSGKRTREPLDIRSGSEDLVREIASLSALDAEALRQKWKALFGADPLPYLGRSFMVRAIGYRLQERALGGLKPSAERTLERVVDGGSEATAERIPKRRAGAGTVLIREWRGVHHRVTVLDHEVVYQGRRYKSLSEVARVITGTRWSGPLFFGLKDRAKEAANGR